MPKATAQDETIAGVAGVRFTTDAQQDTDAERRLQEIQATLAGGVDVLPPGTTLPHLNLYSAETVDGPTQTYISLWVPEEQRSHAAELLESAGFTVS